jgi:hypothetical protein
MMLSSGAVDRVFGIQTGNHGETHRRWTPGVAGGVGRALLRAIAAQARSAGIQRISVSVEWKNFARKLYLFEDYQVVDSSDTQFELGRSVSLTGGSLRSRGRRALLWIRSTSVSRSTQLGRTASLRQAAGGRRQAGMRQAGMRSRPMVSLTEGDRRHLAGPSAIELISRDAAATAADDSR